MKKIISLIVFMNLTNLCAEEIDLDMSMGVDIGCNISCSDFSLGTLRINSVNDRYRYDIDMDGNIISASGGGTLFGAIPAECTIACSDDVKEVELIVGLENGGVVYGDPENPDSSGVLAIGVGTSWSEKNGECNIDVGEVLPVSLSSGHISQKLCGGLIYEGEIPKGSYSNKYYVSINY